MGEVAMHVAQLGILALIAAALIYLALNWGRIRFRTLRCVEQWAAKRLYRSGSRFSLTSSARGDVLQWREPWADAGHPINESGDPHGE